MNDRLRQEDGNRNAELFSLSELVFTLPLAPVSLQGSPKAKQKIRDVVKIALRETEVVFVGDVTVTLEWLVHEQQRYESVSSPDIDNILKPILDSLSGPDGILVDDCQIQAVHCFWIDSYTGEQSVNIHVRPNLVDEWLPKRGLFFVDLGNGLCFPFIQESDPEAIAMTLALIEYQLIARSKLVKDHELSYYNAKGVMPSQRLFHRARAMRFSIKPLTDFEVAKYRLRFSAGPAQEL